MLFHKDDKSYRGSTLIAEKLPLNILFSRWRRYLYTLLIALHQAATLWKADI